VHESYGPHPHPQAVRTGKTIAMVHRQPIRTPPSTPIQVHAPTTHVHAPTIHVQTPIHIQTPTRRPHSQQIRRFQFAPESVGRRRTANRRRRAGTTKRCHAQRQPSSACAVCPAFLLCRHRCRRRRFPDEPFAPSVAKRDPVDLVDRCPWSLTPHWKSGDGRDLRHLAPPGPGRSVSRNEPPILFGRCDCANSAFSELIGGPS
jgi:hypothetical protein